MNYKQIINRLLQQKEEVFFSQRGWAQKESLHFLSLEEFNVAAVDNRFSVTVENIRFECLLQRNIIIKQPCTLLVFFNGAGRGNTLFFSRSTYANSFDGYILNIADPMLPLYNLNLGWYYGTPKLSFHLLSAKIITKVAEQLGVQSIILYGSSGGGYAALHTGKYIENSCIVCLNPQIYISKYIINYQYNQWITQTKIETGCEDFYSRNDTPKCISGMKNTILIIQNMQDTHHIKEHLIPLANSFDIIPYFGLSTKNNFSILIYDAEGGHNALDDESIFKQIINILYKLKSNQPAEQDAKDLCKLFNKIYSLKNNVFYILNDYISNCDDAFSQIKRLESIELDSNYKYLALASAFKKNGQLEEFLMYMHKSLNIKPYEKKLLQESYTAFLTYGTEKECLDICETSASYYVEESWVWRNYAKCYAKYGRRYEAMLSYEKVISINDHDATSMTELAAMYFGNKSFRRAKYLALQSLKVDQKNYLSLIILSRIAFAQNKIKKALDLVDTALKLNPDSINAQSLKVELINAEKYYF